MLMQLSQLENVLFKPSMSDVTSDARPRATTPDMVLVARSEIERDGANGDMIVEVEDMRPGTAKEWPRCN